jgi:hypothetical protein
MKERKEAEMEDKEKSGKDRDKKQVPLRLSAELYREIAAWAEDDFRSVNGQIEYLLHQCVRKRKGEKEPK